MIYKFFFHNLFGNTINQWRHYFCHPNNGTTSIQFSSIVDAQSNPKTRSLAYIDEGSR
jgi:hypothetical protein